MIVDWLLGLFQTVVGSIGDTLPSTDADPFQYVTTVLDNLGGLNYFLPISETFTVVVGVMVVFPLFAGVSLVLWVLAFLRGGSARG